MLEIARQPYFRWLTTQVTDAELVEAYRVNALFDATATIPSSATGSSSMRHAKPANR